MPEQTTIQYTFFFVNLAACYIIKHTAKYNKKVVNDIEFSQRFVFPIRHPGIVLERRCYGLSKFVF